ncbi:MAG: N-acetylmuramoyl-L-alanine amidase [Elusimicrobia bacterium]|nr:N-acetylmuramoyl-L-alanine amidase [Elusimicrobiota bacterium]
MRIPLLLSATLAIIAAVPVRASAEVVAVVVSGKPREAVEAYKNGSKLYLDAKQVGALYGSQVYWYPVSGRIQLSMRGRALSLLAGSDKASTGKEALSLGDPTLVRASRAFLPLSFLVGDGFARWSGYETHYDARTRTLVIERQGTVGIPRAFSYNGRTRISVELAPNAIHRAAARGTGAAELVIDYGVAEGDESVSLDDGVVASYAIKQEPKLVRLSVRFAETGQKWRAFELSSPRRAVIEVFGPGVEPGPAPVVDKAVAEVKGPAKKPAPEPQAALPPAVEEKPVKTKRLIVVDPGHGGKDPGATGGRGTREKDVNLAAALELTRVLRERGDFEVVLTREDDTFIPLSDRSELANSKEADLFVSLHCNAASNKQENGFEVYSVSETASDPEAEKLAAAENASLEFEGKNPQDETAKMILLAMTKTEMINESATFAALSAKTIAKRADVVARGAKQAGFYVLRGTHAPAILVEMAFVTHAKDEAKLSSRRFRRKMAEGVASGIVDYARRQGWLQ